jgi:hypothetical protein
MSVIGVDNFTRRSGLGEHRDGPVLGKLSVPTSPQPAGLPHPTGHHGPGPVPAAVRPLSTHWMSDELVADTRRVWSKAYGRVISDEEVVEILTNVRKLAEVLLRT